MTRLALPAFPVPAAEKERPGFLLRKSTMMPIKSFVPVVLGAATILLLLGPVLGASPYLNQRSTLRGGAYRSLSSDIDYGTEKKASAFLKLITQGIEKNLLHLSMPCLLRPSPLTHPPIHLPAYLPGDDISSPCDAMAPCTTDSGGSHCTASNNPFRGYECSGSTDSCTFNVVSYEEDDDIYFRMNHSSTNPSSTCNDLCAHFNSTCLGAREGWDNECRGLDAGVTSYTCTDPMSAYSHSWHIFCTCSSPAWTTGEYEWIACLNLT